MTNIVPIKEASRPMVIFEDAHRALAVATTVDHVKPILFMAAAYIKAAQKAKTKEAEAEAAALELEAERKIGLIMKAQAEAVGLNRGGRPETGFIINPVSEAKPTLAEAGIDKNLAHRARTAAAMSEEEFQEAVEAKRESIMHRPPRGRTKKKKEPQAPGAGAALAAGQVDLEAASTLTGAKGAPGAGAAPQAADSTALALPADGSIPPFLDRRPEPVEELLRPPEAQPTGGTPEAMPVNDMSAEPVAGEPKAAPTVEEAEAEPTVEEAEAELKRLKALKAKINANTGDQAKINPETSARAFAEFKVACETLLPKMQGDDLQEAVAHFAEVVEVPAEELMPDLKRAQIDVKIAKAEVTALKRKLAGKLPPRESRAARWQRHANEAYSSVEELISMQQEFAEAKEGQPDSLQDAPFAQKCDEICGIDLESALDPLGEAANAEVPLGFGRD